MWENKKLHFFILLFLSLTVILGRLHEGGLASLDDCYYAEKSKEILLTGDWFSLYFNYKPRSYEPPPPLYMWSTAVLFKLFGISEYTAKLTSALSGVILIALVYFFARMLYGHPAGIASSFILLTTHYFLAKTQRGMVDVLLALMITAALFCFVKGIGNKKYLLLFGLFTGLAVLTKSILGTVPIFAALCYMIISPERKKINMPFFLAGLAVMAAVASPFFIVGYLKFGKTFLNRQFITNLLDRALYGRMGKASPPYHWSGYFKHLYHIAAQSFPWWIFALFGAVRTVRNRDSKGSILLLWAAIVIIGTSVAKIKSPWHIIPVYPALSMIAGNTVSRYLKAENRIKVVKGIAVFSLAVSIFVIVFPFRFVKEENADIRKLAPYIKGNTAEHEEILIYRLDYWTMMNPLLFYADRPASRPLENEDLLRRAMGTDKRPLCISRISDYERLKGKYGLIKLEGSMVLFSGLPLPVTPQK